MGYYITELPKKPEPEKSQDSSWMSALTIDVGVLVLVPILLGLTTGILCDSLFASKPTCTVVFLFLGLVASLYNIFKLTRQHNGTTRTTRQH